MKQRLFSPHHYLLYVLTPNYVSLDGLMHHNSYGFRGKEFDVQKPEGIYRIVCMGESTTQCNHIPNDQHTYPARLEHHLQAIFPQNSLEVINAGVSGYTSAENLLNFIFKVEPLTPDLIVFYYTHNDVHPRRFPNLSRDYQEYSKIWCECPSKWGRIKSWFSKKHKILGIYDHTRRFKDFPDWRDAKEVENNPPIIFEKNMTLLLQLARANDIRMLLVNPPYKYIAPDGLLPEADPFIRGVYEHREIIKRLAQEYHCGYFDLLGKMPHRIQPMKDESFDMKKREDPYYLDWTHVNEQGADLMASYIAQGIKEAIMMKG